jgi:hypothetical protein
MERRNPVLFKRSTELAGRQTQAGQGNLAPLRASELVQLRHYDRGDSAQLPDNRSCFVSHDAAASIVSTAAQEWDRLHQLAALCFPCYDTAWVSFLGKLFERRVSLDMPGPALGFDANDCGRERRRRDIHHAPAPFR